MTGGLIETLPERPSESGPAWLRDVRREAATTVREGGFPGKKHEAWRFTSVREVVEQRLAPVAGDLAGARDFAAEALEADGTWRVIVANGELDTHETPPEGVRLRRLTEVLEESPEVLEGVLGHLAGREHFAGLNAALFDDGVVITVERGAAVETPIHLVHVATGDGASHPRVVVLVEESAQASLVESFLDAGGDGAHLTNVVTEVDVRANGRLDHTRLTYGTPRAMQIGALAVRQARDSHYASRVVTLGGKLSRLDVDLRFEGPGAEAELDGVYHVDGTDHVDHQLRVVHATGHCTSHVRYRGLLDGKGHAVFNAVGIVERDAQRSSTHQENRNLLLSGDARVDTKPHLEIDADDIMASHGTTVGALDPAQAFYLRSRGIPEALARDLLTFAFVEERVERIPHPPIAQRIGRALLARLPHGEELGDVLGDAS